MSKQKNSMTLRQMYHDQKNGTQQQGPEMQDHRSDRYLSPLIGLHVIVTFTNGEQIQDSLAGRGPLYTSPGQRQGSDETRRS